MLLLWWKRIQGKFHRKRWGLDRLNFGEWRKGISGVRNNIHKDKKGKGVKKPVLRKGFPGGNGLVWRLINGKSVEIKDHVSVSTVTITKYQINV